MRMRALKIVCAMLALTVLLSGCSLPFIGSKNKLSLSGTDIAGQVTAVSDKDITLTLGYITGSGDESAASASPAPSASPSAQSDASAALETASGADTAVPPTVDEGGTDTASATASPEVTASAAQETAQPESSESGASAAVTRAFVAGSAKATVTIGDASILFASDGSTAAALGDVKVGSILNISFDQKGKIVKIVIMDVPRMVIADGQSYFAANEFSTAQDVSKATYDSTGDDENAVIVDNGAKVNFDGVTVKRASSGSTGGDAAVLYGAGAAMLSAGGTSYIKNGTVATDAKGGTGIFAYGSGAAYAENTKIDTSSASSGGISASGGGKLYAWDLTVDTKGEASAAVAGAGSGTIVADGGLYSTSGAGSPAVSSASSVALNNATLKAASSDAARVEGNGSLYLFNSQLSGNMADDENYDAAWTVAVYQGEGGSQQDKASFQMVGGSIESGRGGLFYTTNTASDILLSGVDIKSAEDSVFFLRCTGNTSKLGWGSQGANGAVCSFTGVSQEMKGNILWDSISKLDFYMEEGSTLTGAVNDVETWAGKNGSGGHCNMYISENSTWVVTGDSALTTLYNEGKVVDKDGKTVTVKDFDGKTLVKGESKYVVTVRAYGSPADFSGASAASAFADFKTAKPAGF
jgi:hypothetical protein